MGVADDAAAGPAAAPAAGVLDDQGADQTGLAETTAVSRGRTNRRVDSSTRVMEPMRWMVSGLRSQHQLQQPCSGFGRRGWRRLAGRLRRRGGGGS